MGSIRPKNGGYEGRITIKANGKSKQISLFNKDKRILVQEMIKAKQEANDNEYVEKDKITLENKLRLFCLFLPIIRPFSQLQPGGAEIPRDIDSRQLELLV